MCLVCSLCVVVCCCFCLGFLFVCWVRVCAYFVVVDCVVWVVLFVCLYVVVRGWLLVIVCCWVFVVRSHVTIVSGFCLWGCS